MTEVRRLLLTILIRRLNPSEMRVLIRALSLTLGESMGSETPTAEEAQEAEDLVKAIRSQVKP